MQLWGFYTWSMIYINNGIVMSMYLVSDEKFTQEHAILTAFILCVLTFVIVVIVSHIHYQSGFTFF